VGGLIYTPTPVAACAPLAATYACPPYSTRLFPLQHTPVRARARCRTRLRPDTCLHRNGCARIAFCPHEDTVFAPDPTRLRPLTRVCARNHGCTKSLCPVPRIRTNSHQSAPDACAPAFADVRRVRARSHPPAPISTRSCPMRLCLYQWAHAAD
jgi:hypothetical protein